MKTIKKLLLALTLVLTIISCSTPEQNTIDCTKAKITEILGPPILQPNLTSIKIQNNCTGEYHIINVYTITNPQVGQEITWK